MTSKKRDFSLNWNPRPKGMWVVDELIRSDAFRSLSSTEKDIWLFAMTRRKYPKKKRNYWEPHNKGQFKLPIVAIEDFFKGEVRGMNCAPPHPDTIRKAIKNFMRVGLLSLVKQGGGGKGDQNIYRLEEMWRTWKKGDGPCFEKKGMSRAKGFCAPGSGEFFRADVNKKGG